jgi:methyl-accepting chemotaxis protein
MLRPQLPVALLEGGAWVVALALFVVRADVTGVGVLVSLLLTRALAVAWTRRAAADPIDAGALERTDTPRLDVADDSEPPPTRERERETELLAISSELAHTTAELHATTKSQDEAVEQQAQRVLEFQAVIDRLALAAADISTAADEVRDNATQTRDTTHTVATEIAQLDAEAAGIAQLIELLREIADRSDILALNGALEASRAGEAGRAFALVAAEMRRLAERVTQTAAIMRAGMERVTAAAARTNSATARSRKLADDTVAAAERISKLTGEQRSETEQIAESMLDLANDVTAMVWSTSETQTVASRLLEHVRALETISAQHETQHETQD